jgi:hypothetical protein
MGYGVRIMTKTSYAIRGNIVGCSTLAGIDHTRFAKNQDIAIEGNILFAKKQGNLEH